MTTTTRIAEIRAAAEARSLLGQAATVAPTLPTTTCQCGGRNFYLDGNCSSCGKPHPAAKRDIRGSGRKSRHQHLDPTTSATNNTVASVTIAGTTYQVEQHSGMWAFRRTPEAGWTVADPEMSLLIEKELCPRGGRHERGADGTRVKCLEPAGGEVDQDGNGEAPSA
jgi:hypothetical protein